MWNTMSNIYLNGMISTMPLASLLLFIIDFYKRSIPLGCLNRISANNICHSIEDISKNLAFNGLNPISKKEGYKEFLEMLLIVKSKIYKSGHKNNLMPKASNVYKK